MAKGKVLIIDDEEDVRNSLKFYLSEQNYQIIEAGNGEEGINLLKSGDNMVTVGVILCDIQMPKVNGLDFIKFIQKEAPGIPIVVITGSPDVEMAMQLLKGSVKDYLVKPVEREKLVFTVQKQVAAKKGVGF